MPYNPNRMLTNRDVKVTTLFVKFRCSICSKVTNPMCKEHDGCIEDFEVQVVQLGWARLNQIISEAAQFDSQSSSSSFNVQHYNSACLQEIIVEAPWGNTDAMFLAQVGPELGEALEALVPKMGGQQEEGSSKVQIDEVKKVSALPLPD